MNILDIEINKLFISPTNVRKMLNGVKDETNILDLAKDIKEDITKQEKMRKYCLFKMHQFLMKLYV